MIPNASRLKNSKPKLKISLSYKENITQQPKHSFCAWLAIRDRLSTRDRLSRWDRSIPLSCLLCGGNYESRDHLFFLVILGGRFGRGSFCLCHLLIESVIGGLSYLGFIIRVLGRV